jgi:hypothetical protein
MGTGKLLLFTVGLPYHFLKLFARIEVGFSIPLLTCVIVAPHIPVIPLRPSLHW